MAEYCLDCFNKIEHTDFSKNQVVESNLPSLCEGCGQRKKVVIRIARRSFFPFKGKRSRLS